MACIALLVAEVVKSVRTVSRVSFLLRHRFVRIVFYVGIEVVKFYAFSTVNVRCGEEENL